jgi:CheY-like chemotaxis protein
MSASPQTILLIDDDRAWLDALAEHLQAMGFTVETAESPLRGLTLLEEHDVPVAVIDFQMPEMDGLELLRRIRRRHRDVAVLLLSAEEDPSLASRALAEGARVFLSKAMAPRLLLQRLRQTLIAALTEGSPWRIRPSRYPRILPAPRKTG